MKQSVIYTIAALLAAASTTAAAAEKVPFADPFILLYDGV